MLAQIRNDETTNDDARSQVGFAGRLEVVLKDCRARDGRVARDLPSGEPLSPNTLVAALLAADELRPHLYVAHSASEGGLVTVLGYAKGAALRGRAGAELRVPQKGAWLVCPTRGTVFVVASDRPLTRRDLARLLGSRGTRALSPVPAAASSFGPAAASATPSTPPADDAAPPPVLGDDDAIVAP